MDFRIGFGTDIHRLAGGYPLIIGNITIPYHLGCVGHSDGDALIHAICDALLGALNLGDIGRLFPDNDDSNKNRNSAFFLENITGLIRQKGYEIGNVDTVVNLQKPKLSPFIPQITKRLSEIMNIDADAVSVKAKTKEKMGFVGEEKGIKAEAIVLVYRKK